MKLFITVSFFFLVSINVEAQTNKIKFASLLQAGIFEGQVGTAASIQTINGVQFGKWQIGAGTGLDYYQTRTIPLFIDFRRNLLAKANTPFIYADGGYNFPWLKQEEKLYMQNAKGGLYWDAGIGYSLAALKSSHLFFTAGYCVKKLSNDARYYYDVISSFIPPTNHYDYTLRRLSLKVGLQF